MQTKKSTQHPAKKHPAKKHPAKKHPGKSISNRDRAPGTPPQVIRSAERKERKERNKRRITHGYCAASSNSFFRDRKPHFPDDLLYGPVGAIVRAILPHTEASGVSLYIQMLVGLGNLIGRAPHFMADRQRHGTNLFAVPVGASSRGRKGTAWAHCETVLGHIDEDWLQERMKSGTISGAGLVESFEDTDDKRLLVLEQEFSTVIRALRGHRVSEILRQAWDARKLELLRKRNPVSIMGPHLSLIGHITLAELQNSLPEVERTNGMANRILWAHTERSKLLPEGGDVPNLDSLIEPLRQVVESAQTRGRLNFDEEARQFWHELYPRLTAESPGKMDQILDRAEAQCVRLALLFTLLDGAPEIGMAQMVAAVNLWYYCEASARYIFGQTFANAKAQKIWNALANGPMTKTQISALFGNNARKEQIDVALQELGDSIQIEGKWGGRGTKYRRRDMDGRDDEFPPLSSGLPRNSSRDPRAD